MNDKNLRAKAIRLAYANPHLRQKLLPLLTKRADGLFEQQFDKANKLSQVDPTVAKLIVQSGLSDGGPKGDDAISVSAASLTASALSPSQSTMVLPKAMSMAMGMLDSGVIGGPLGAMISKDNYIMDGHHRWAATVLAGDGKIKGWKANLPGPALLRVLNILSKGAFNVRNGQPGEGSITDFIPAKIEAFLYGVLDGSVTHPQYSYSPEQTAAILTKAFGSPEAGVAQMALNVTKLKKKPMPGAPKREEMPVIQPAQVPQAAELLNSGMVDWHAPYKEASLRAKVVRLAKAKPSLRPHLLPLLKP